MDAAIDTVHRTDISLTIGTAVVWRRKRKLLMVQDNRVLAA